MPSTIPACYAQIRQFEALSKNIDSVVKSLNACDSKFSNLDRTLDANYNVNNDVTPVYHKLKDLDGDISEASNYLKNSVVPAINSAINALYRRIQEIREREEREAAEALSRS